MQPLILPISNATDINSPFQHPLQGCEEVTRMATANHCGKPKYYVVTERGGQKPPRVVRGWRSVQQARRQSPGGIAFTGFHTEEGAEQHARTLLRQTPPKPE